MTKKKKGELFEDVKTVSLDNLDAPNTREQVVDFPYEPLDDITETTVRKGVFDTAPPLESLPPGIRGRLEVLQGPNKGEVFLLDEVHQTLGRRGSNKVILPDPAVSSCHAEIFFTRLMEWRIKDLNSTNGTLLNGSKVSEFVLRSGDKILMGDCLMRFIIDRDSD